MATTCDVTIKLEDAGGNAIENAVVRARYVTPQSTESRTIVSASQWVSATTDVNGDATIALQRNAKCRIVCVEAGLDREFSVPGQATYNLARELDDI